MFGDSLLHILHIVALGKLLAFGYHKAAKEVGDIFNIGIIVAVYLLASRHKFKKQGVMIVRSILKPKWADMLLKELKFVDRMFGGFIDGKIAGNCEISFRSGVKVAHRAVIAIAILEKYWNLGIGSAFFTEIL